jgi:uncharacterized protein YajQ (UPF0234 family)
MCHLLSIVYRFFSVGIENWQCAITMCLLCNEAKGVNTMPSFDVVSEVDLHELTNAVDQSQRIVANRFDFKGVDASFARDQHTVVITAEAEFQTTQMEDMLRAALIKCNIDPGAMDCGDPVESGKTVTVNVVLRNGLDSDQCRKVVKKIKEGKTKVQSQVQGDEDFGSPLQFNNFRD